ncbi:MAG: C45 family autoproteolytic acyltransferase/hydrolase [bacterium]
MVKANPPAKYISLSLITMLCGILLCGCGSPSPSIPPESGSIPFTSPTETGSTPSPFLPQPTGTPTTPQIGGTREDIGGWIHLRISGSPYERGFQHGYLLGEEIMENIKIQDYSLKHDTGQDFSFFREKAVQFYGEMVDPEYQEEMKGIADGARAQGVEVSYEDIFCLNALIDLTSWWRIKVQGSASQLNHCSAFIATGDWTADGKIIIAHSTWWDYFSFSPWNLILDITPEEGYRIVMQSAPGLIWSGSDFFLTGAGLMGCETTIYNFQRFREEGAPAFLRSRRAMQYADSLEDFVNLLNEGNNGGYPNSWLLGDVRTGEIARFEQGLEYVSFEKKSNGYFAGYNAAENPDIQSECGGWSADDPSNFSGARKVRFEELMVEYKGRIDVEIAKIILADHYDTWFGKENPSSRTICGHYVYHEAPSGAMDGKVTTSDLASGMHLWAFWGAPCGIPFVAEEAIEENPQFQWLKGYLKDLPTGSWSLF